MFDNVYSVNQRRNHSLVIDQSKRETYVRSGKTIILLADATGVDLDFSIVIK